MSYKPRSLNRFLDELNSSIFLPHIQRPFVWDEEQMALLLDSLLQGFPIQTLLLWRTKEAVRARRFMSELDWDANLSDLYDNANSQVGTIKTFVLDGQQRLQSLYTLFSGTMVDSEQRHSAAYIDLFSGPHGPGESDDYEVQFYVDDPGLPWFRLSRLRTEFDQVDREDIVDLMNDQLDELDDVETTADTRKAVSRTIGKLVDLLRSEKYFWYQELDGTTNQFPYATVLEIFVRVNSGGTKLSASDLMFAAMKEGWDEVEQRIETATTLLNDSGLSFEKTFVLKCLLVAHGKGATASPEKFSGQNGENLLKAVEEEWDRAQQAFEKLHDFMVTQLRVASSRSVKTYSSFIPLFDYLYHNQTPTPESYVAMKAYHYRAQMLGWYSRGTDGTVTELHKICGIERGASEPFPQDELATFFGRRGLKTQIDEETLHRATLRHIILDLVYTDQTGGSAFNARFRGNQPHVDHIYPKYGLVNKLGFLGPEVNHLGNFRFVGATDNIRKRAEKPGSYFSRLKNAGVKIKIHLLDPEYTEDPARLAWNVESYQEFRDRRFDRIREIVRRVTDPGTQS
jgi:hypothetical protein